MSGLPDNWTYATLESLGQWGSGGTPPRTNSSYFEGGKIPWLIIGDLNDSVVTNAATHITEAGLANSSAKLLPPETLLVAMYGSIGKLGITGVECATNQAIAFCKPNTEIVSLWYLFYAVMNAKDGLVALGQGGAQQNISQGILKAYEVPLAPLGEQKRIADKLDAVLARVDACRNRLDRIPTILKRFRQSVVSAAVSGKLTEEWRSQQRTDGEADHITSTTLADLCQTGRVITYGVIKLGDETPDGVPCLRTSNVRWLRIDTTGMKRIAPSLSTEYSRTILEGAEVLVNVRGTLGGVAVTSADMVGWNVSREVAVVPVDPAKADSEFLALWIAADRQQRWLSKVEKGVAYVGINIEDLRTLPVELPSFTEQREIVRRVESLFAYADRIEARYSVVRAQVEKLTPSLLAKAFRGDLVPQDPNDEPASILLDQNRKHGANQVPQKKTGRSSKEIPMKTSPPISLTKIIDEMDEDFFTFDQLRSKASRDYESLKEELFTLLADSGSGLTQVFDADARSMKFKRERK